MTLRGSGQKPVKLLDKVEVAYSESHWNLLRSLRTRAVEILEALGPLKDSAIAHGSLARGDVDGKSDVDILVPTRASSQIVEARLESSGLQVY